MIPQSYESRSTSSAERRVFNLLQLDPDTSGWVVFHSLGLASRSARPYGEIDFVILLPDGIVVCLEVKGGRVACRDGVWTTVDRSGQESQLKKSPFMQARDGMFGLRTAIQQKFGVDDGCSKFLFTYAVLFPDTSAPPPTPEFEPIQAIGRDDLNSPISRKLRRLVASQQKKTGYVCPSDVGEGVRRLRQFLRPDFERIVARSTSITESEAALVSLTEDQYTVLDMIAENSRSLIEGAAGTGKTLLALEYARLACQSGQRTILLCYNRLLGAWLEDRAKGIDSNLLLAGNYHRILRNFILASSYAAEFERAESGTDEHHLFSELIPAYGLFAADELKIEFDTLVIDEGQDLLSRDTLDIFGGIVKGGLAGGHWCIFGDLTRQSLYGNLTREQKLHLLEERCPHFSRTKLVTNCRNTRRIGEETALLSGFPSPPYKLGQIDGLSVDYRYWETPQEQLDKLNELIRTLIDDGVEPEDIVVLSPRRFSECVANQLSCTTKRKGPVIPRELRSQASSPSKSAIGFATIHAFKGMESMTLIMCDIDHIDSDEPQALLYTGMSRARSYLAMLVHHNVREGIGKALARKLTQDWKHDNA